MRVLQPSSRAPVTLTSIPITFIKLTFWRKMSGNVEFIFFNSHVDSNDYGMLNIYY